MKAHKKPQQPLGHEFQDDKHRDDGNQQSFLVSEKGQESSELQKFIEIYDGATEGNALLDREGHIIYVNQTACSWLGYAQEDLLRLHLSDVGADYDEAPYQRVFDQVN